MSKSASQSLFPPQHAKSKINPVHKFVQCESGKLVPGYACVHPVEALNLTTY